MEKSWDTLTPGELRKAKIVSIIFLITAIVVVILINKTIGIILLTIWMLSGSGPFILGSRGSIKNIMNVMKAVEPGYKSWKDDDVQKQIKIIRECGYVWYEKDGKVGFKHSQSDIFLLIKGLHFYKPEEIKRVYKEVWSKQSLDQLQKKDEFARQMEELIKNNASDDEFESLFKKYNQDYKSNTR
jgi:hypothetical protein